MRIVLAHGVLGFGLFDFGVLGSLEYFNGVAKHLHDKFGAQVLTTKVPPIGSVQERGRKLADQIVAAFDSHERVHILAHSMGGLDARWAMKNVPGFAVRVKTLVAIGTPHRGSPVADAIRGGNPALLRHIPLPIVAQLRINQAALNDLATDHREAPDVDDPQLKYRYVVGDLSQPNAHCSHAFRAIQAIFGVRSANDGVVTVDSATRGGTVNSDLTWPVDHAGEIGWNLDRPIPAAFPLADHSHFARYDDVIALL